jgi:hypothetical protein
MYLDSFEPCCWLVHLVIVGLHRLQGHDLPVDRNNSQVGSSRQGRWLEWEIRVEYCGISERRHGNEVYTHVVVADVAVSSTAELSVDVGITGTSIRVVEVVDVRLSVSEVVVEEVSEV